MKSARANLAGLAFAAAFPQFTDVGGAGRLAFRHQASHTPDKYLLETMGSGIALFDFDGDGLLDVFLVNGAALPTLDKSQPRYWNRLFRNRGNGSFDKKD